MVQKLISKLSVLLVLLTFVAACSDKTAYTDVIPADAAMVISIDLQSLALKAGLNDQANKVFKKQLMEVLKNESSATAFQEFEKIIDNPLQSGIDLLSPFYGFTNQSLSYSALVAGVSSQSDLRTLLEMLVKEQNLPPITKEDGYSYISSDELLLAFNETRLVVATTLTNQTNKELKKEIAQLLHQDAEKSINSNNSFKEMQKQSGEIRFFFPIETLTKLTAANTVDWKNLSGEETKGLTILGGLSFDKGRITLRSGYHSNNEATTKILKEREDAVRELNNKLQTYFPASTLAFMNIGINGKELGKTLLTHQQNNNQLKALKNFDELIKIVNSIQGDLAMGWVNLSDDKPTWLIYAEVERDDIFQSIVANNSLLDLNETALRELGKERYVADLGRTKLYFGVRNKLLYATNDESLYSRIGEPVEPSIQQAKCMKNRDKKKLFMTINFEAFAEHEMLQLFMKLILGNGAESLFSHLEVSSDKSETGEVVLVFQNQEENSLKQLISCYGL